MPTPEKIKRLLAKKVVLLDGAMGTQLQKYGMPAGVCPELWCLKHPEVLQRVQRQYVEAGADVLYTATFGANRYKLKQYGQHDVRGINKKLALLARKAAGKGVLVAGDIGPTGHFVAPFGEIVFEEAVASYKEQVRGLLQGGVDLFVIETMMDIQEARAALIAVRELSRAFVMVTMTFEKNRRTLNGTDAVSALVTLQSLGASAVGCNCSTGPEDMRVLISEMKPFATVPLIAKPNAGMPVLVAGKTHFNMQPDAFARAASQCVVSGVNMIGGCCGTTPEHISALKNAIRHKRPVPPLRKKLSAVSSAAKTVVIQRGGSALVVGERINPTGKIELQKELLSHRFSLLRHMAKQQEEEGANLLDVNMGVPGSDEAKLMTQAVGILSVTTSLPLVIDSGNPEAVEAALRVYPGRALLNSVPGEPNKMKYLFSLAEKYGAMCIVLPVSGKFVPQTACQRKKIIRAICRQAARYGLSKDDLVVDCLALSIASGPRNAIEALDTVSWCAKDFACHCLLGISNISFGLPNRKVINACFLSLAEARGLTMAIGNPAVRKSAHMQIARDLLLNKKNALSRFLSLEKKDSAGGKNKIIRAATPAQKIFQGIIEGNSDEIEGLIGEALREGVPAIRVVNTMVIPAIKRVGELFDKKEYFLPQLIGSAETTKQAFGYLKPYLKKEKTQHIKKAIVILSTVKGDIHDIGKNIVSLMLQNHGFQVIDLGKDVSASRIVQAARRTHADIIGLSALMTTTMVNMKEVIELAHKNKLDCKFIVGGAVVTSAFAESIGAAYGRDSVEAVKVIEKLCK